MDTLEHLTLFRSMILHAKEKAVKDRDFEEAEHILEQGHQLIQTLKPEISTDLLDELTREHVNATLYVEHVQGDFPIDPEQE